MAGQGLLHMILLVPSIIPTASNQVIRLELNRLHGIEGWILWILPRTASARNVDALRVITSIVQG